MFDIHSHILPGIDDGASSMQVSMDMLVASVASGFHTIIATPHLVDSLNLAYDDRVRDAYNELLPHAWKVGIRLMRGFEIRLSPNTPDQLRRGAPITLGNTNVVLLDLPFIEWPLYADTTLFGIQTVGFRPVLAHPERYPAIQENPARALNLVQRGIILQVTIGSFSGIFGKRAKRAAEALLALDTVQIVATDAHSAGHRMAAVPAGLARLENLVGQVQLHDLTVTAPTALLAGPAVPDPVRPLERSWRQRIPVRRR